MLSMNKCAKFNTNPIFKQRKISSPNRNLSDDDDSLTDVSVIIRAKPSFIKPKSTPTYDQFVPNNQLFQSLIAYANSFNAEEALYSIQDLNPTNSFKQRTKSSTSYGPTCTETNQFVRHKSCEHLLNDSKSTTVNPPVPIKLIPSHFFSERNYTDENTTITDGSKFEWGYKSDKSNLTNKSSKEIFNNYQTTTNSQNLKPFPSIIVREILHKHPSTTASGDRCQLPKRKIIYDERHADERSKNIIIEYDQINVTVDKNINQRKYIKRVHPNQYVQQYGPSLYSNKVFHNLLMNIMS